ncbi:GLPGLI family protein [Myroides sp. WP-1]|uniref:GLPGLI family protein n=1 Tax=Myroides sp. WP-1 TaxID=2759944 RepID=UPI0015FB8A1F|nr:GLPGLI family protein [Myroides sp. WP-1]MBB1139772.1 GLPGLI family protein [Myroides sp. WP-1]
MKKLLFYLLIINGYINLYAQEQTVMRYNYLGKLILDKTQPEKIEEYLFVLDIDSNQSSRFIELALLERKQAIAEIKSQDELMQTLRTYRSKTNFTIFYSNGILTTFSKINKTIFTYDEPKNTLIWKIEPGNEQWQNYTVQKATTFFEGRHWNVLFTTAIPLIEGPYKFKNLPGFVVKAWDDEHHYEFEFANSKKITIKNWNLSNPKDLITPITVKQYEKALKVYQNKSYRDLLIEMNPKNAETVPAEFAEKVGLRSNPIFKVE